MNFKYIKTHVSTEEHKENIKKLGLSDINLGIVNFFNSSSRKRAKKGLNPKPTGSTHEPAVYPPG